MSNMRALKRIAKIAVKAMFSEKKKTVDNTQKTCYNNKVAEVPVTEVYKLLNPSVRIQMNSAVGMRCLVFCNELRNDESTTRWAYERFKGDVEQAENMWVRRTRQQIGLTKDGRKVYQDDVEILNEQPIISWEFNHMLVFYSNDVNKLKYIQYEILKRMKTISNLEQLLEKSGEMV